MNIYAIISLLGCIVALKIGLVILIRDWKRPENILFFLYAFSGSLNALVEYGYRHSQTLEEAEIWWRFDLFWIFPIAFLMHFVLVFTEKKEILDKYVTYVLIYGSALILLVTELTTDLITQKPVREYWGWTYTMDYSSPVTTLVLLVAGSAMIYSVYLLFEYTRTTVNKTERRKAIYVGAGLSIPILAGLITEAVGPYAGVKIPQMTQTAFIAGAALIGYSIWKNSVLSFSPHCVEDSIFGTMTESIVLVTNSGNIQNLNHAAEKLTGYSGREIVGSSINKILNDKDTVQSIFLAVDSEEFFSDKILRDYETALLRKDGIEIPVSLTATVFRNRVGSVTGIICSLLDITRHVLYENELRAHRHHFEELVDERTKELSTANKQYLMEIEEHRRTASMLSESEELYRTLVETSPDAIIMLDPDCKLKKVNLQAVILFGFADEYDMLSQRAAVQEMVVPEERGLIDHICKSKLKKNSFQDIELNMQRKNGSIFTAEVRTSEVRSTDSDRKSMLMVVRDITRKKHIEEKLRLRQRIDSIGNLAGGIAHDFNNLLTGIMGNINLLEMEKHLLNDDQKECVDDAMISAEKAALLIREFQALSRECYVEPCLLDVRDITNLVIGNINQEYQDRKIPIETDMETGGLHVSADLDQLVQVLHHIVRNSIQAIDEKGWVPGDKINISANTKRIGPDDITGLRQGEYVHIIVEDSGVGMNDEVRCKAFDPMFTTRMRNSQKGQGLGLAIVYNIITNNLNGSIEILSSEGDGTAVHVYLPKSYVSPGNE